MTIVLAWERPNFGDICAIADSRVSDAEGPILNSAPKLFPLEINVHVEAKRKPRIAFRHSVGFAYAGSSIVAQSVYAFASASLKDLFLKRGGSVPSLKNIAEAVGDIAEKYVEEVWGKYYPDNRGRAEFFIFGYCKRSNKLQIFKITPVVVPKFSIKVEEAPLGGPRLLCCLGDKTAISEFQRKQVELQNVPYQEVLQSLLAEDRINCIGGGVQTIIAGRSGARVLPTLVPTGDKTADLMFLNLHLDRLRPVGDCTIGTEAIGPWPRPQ